MRSTVTSTVVLAGTIVGLASIGGCAVHPGDSDLFGKVTSGTQLTGGVSGNAATSAGTSGAAGSAGSSAGSAGMSNGGTGSGGMTAGASGNAMAGTGGAGGEDAAGAGGMGGMGGEPARLITDVWKSDGCGTPYTGTTGGTPITIETMGEKAADCADKLNGQAKCGPWGQEASTWRKDPVPRDYYVYLPQNYDPNTVYSLVFLGPGCGGDGTEIYGLNNNVDNTAIRIGLTPPPTYVGHGTNENQGCFDDKEGDDSVDWVFYEDLYDKLNGELCFDRNRVFASGNSSGAWFSNELGCKYAGDETRPVRAILPNTGGLPTDARHVPTCTTAPMAGMWVHEVGDMVNGFDGNQVAIARAMSRNNCTVGNSWQTAQTENYPIGGENDDDVCKRITSCDPLYPLVVCALPGSGHGGHENVVTPGFSTFIKAFSAGALITP